MNLSSTLETPEGTAELNKGLDLMIATNRADPEAVVTPHEQAQLSLAFFSHSELASLLVLAVRRLAGVS
jgi:hypothetical protein